MALFDWFWLVWECQQVSSWPILAWPGVKGLTIKSEPGEGSLPLVASCIIEYQYHLKK